MSLTLCSPSPSHSVLLLSSALVSLLVLLLPWSFGDSFKKGGRQRFWVLLFDFRGTFLFSRYVGDFCLSFSLVNVTIIMNVSIHPAPGESLVTLITTDMSVLAINITIASRFSSNGTFMIFMRKRNVHSYIIAVIILLSSSSSFHSNRRTKSNYFVSDVGVEKIHTMDDGSF